MQLQEETLDVRCAGPKASSEMTGKPCIILRYGSMKQGNNKLTPYYDGNEPIAIDGHLRRDGPAGPAITGANTRSSEGETAST